MRTITTYDNSLRVDDEIIIAGVYLPDCRTRWQRFRDWLLRRPAPSAAPQVFRITKVITNSAWPDGRGKGGEYRVDTIFGSTE